MRFVLPKNIIEYKKLIEVAEYHEPKWIVFQPLLKKNTTDEDCYYFFDEIIQKVNKKTLVGIQNAKE